MQLRNQNDHFVYHHTPLAALVTAGPLRSPMGHLDKTMMKRRIRDYELTLSLPGHEIDPLKINRTLLTVLCGDRCPVSHELKSQYF